MKGEVTVAETLLYNPDTLRPVARWEVPMYGRPCVVTYRGGEQKKVVFRALGSDYEDLNGGVGQFPAAIVELEDGSLESVYVEQVRFTDTGENKIGGNDNAETDY